MKQKLLLSVISGVLIALSFPLVIGSFKLLSLGAFAWVALVPLFFAIRNETPKRTFLLTFVCAFVLFAGTVFWAGHALYVFGGISLPLSILLVVLMVAILSAHIALAPFLASLVEKYWRGEKLVWLPVMWVAIELSRNYFPFGGFPWANIAMSQWNNLYFIQLADVGGIYLIIFILIWTNAFIAELLARASGEKISGLIPKTVLTIFILTSVFVYGAVRISKMNALMSDAPSVQIALIQGNISQDEKWSELSDRKNLDVYRNAVAKLKNTKLHAVIWPESSFPWSIDANARNIDPEVLGFEKSSESNPFTVLGAITSASDDEYYNSAFLVDGKGDILGRYDKVHLAPFGEYVPFKEVLFFAKKLTAPAGNFNHGSRYGLLSAGGILMAPLICYEDIFPEISREATLLGADIFVNITNNAWFGRTSAPYQQLAMSVFRAVENRRYLLRSTNTGVSALIAPTGKIMIESQLFEPATIVSNVGIMDVTSFYTKFGNWFAYGCSAYAIAGLLFAVFSVVFARSKPRGV